MPRILVAVCSSVFAAFPFSTNAADRTLHASATAQVAYTSPSTVGDTAKPGDAGGPLVFAAPPRESPEKGEEIYGPVAAYLSQVLGRPVVYQYPGTWGVYRTEMVRGAYDIVFDGPHFNSYRAEKLNHNILAKMTQQHQFVVVVRKSEKFASVKDLTGRTFCTHAPPNLGTLVLLDQFDNPARQPVILNTKGWNNIYKGVITGRCTAGVLPELNLKQYDKEQRVKVLFRAPGLPNQGFSAGPRLTAGEQAKLAQALTAPAAKEPTAKLRAAYKVGDAFVPANNAEYAGISRYLRNEWGYY